MRNYFVTLLVVFGLCLAIPAQAQSRRRNCRDYTRNYSHDYHYRGYGGYRSNNPTAAVRDWGNSMRYGMASLSYDHNRSICERHLARYGWDRVAESRCRFAQGDAREMRRLERNSRRYVRNRGYRDGYRDIDVILDGAGAVGSIWGAIEARRANNKLEELIEQEARTQELLIEQENSSKTTEREEAHVRIPQIWINRTGSYTICTKDQGNARWTTVLPGTKVEIKDATPDHKFGVKWMIIQNGCKCNDEVTTPIDSCNPGFRHESDNIYSIICKR